MGEDEIRAIVRAAVEEFVSSEKTKAEPAHQAQLEEERKARSGLEQRVNELTAETVRSRAVADEAERSSAVRAELHRLGVAKVDLAYRAVKDDIQRTEDGKLTAKGGEEVKDYLARFAAENPELLPARLAGGSGASPGQKQSSGSGAVDLDKIRPGMNPEELERVRQEITRVAMQTMRGL